MKLGAWGTNWSAACLCQLGRKVPGRLSSQSAWQRAADSPPAATQGQPCTPHGQTAEQCWTRHLRSNKATHEAMHQQSVNLEIEDVMRRTHGCGMSLNNKAYWRPNMSTVIQWRQSFLADIRYSI